MRIQIKSGYHSLPSFLFARFCSLQIIAVLNQQVETENSTCRHKHVTDPGNGPVERRIYHRIEKCRGQQADCPPCEKLLHNGLLQKIEVLFFRPILPSSQYILHISFFHSASTTLMLPAAEVSRGLMGIRIHWAAARDTIPSAAPTMKGIR